MTALPWEPRPRRAPPPHPLGIFGAGTALWLRGDLGVTLVSGAVSAWADQGPHGNHATQGTAGARPAPAFSAALNGQAVVDFTAASRWMAIAHHASLAIGADGMTIYVVAEFSSGGTVRTCVAKWDDSGGSYDWILWHREFGGGTRFRATDGSNLPNYIATAGSSAGGAHLLRARADGVDTIGMQLNAAAEATDTRGGFTDHGVNVRINQNTDIEYGSQKLAELVIATGQHTTAQDEAMRRYVRHRYGLTV